MTARPFLRRYWASLTDSHVRGAADTCAPLSVGESRGSLAHRFRAAVLGALPTAATPTKSDVAVVDEAGATAIRPPSASDASAALRRRVRSVVAVFTRDSVPPVRRHVAAAAVVALFAACLGLAFGATVLSGGDTPVRPAQGSTPEAVQLPVPAPAVSVAFSPGGNLLATGTSDASVQLWNAAGPVGPVPLATLTVGEAGAAPVAFSPDGRILAVGGRPSAPAQTGDALSLWDVSNPTVPRSLARLDLPPSDGAVTSLAFDPVGNVLATGSTDSDLLLLWNIAVPAQPVVVATIPTGLPNVSSVGFSRDGRLLATGSTDAASLRLWDVATRTPLGVADVEEPHEGQPGSSVGVSSLAFSPDGHTLAAGGTNGGTAWRWSIDNPARPTLLGALQAVHTGGGAASVAFSPDGRILVVGSNALHLWNVADPTRPVLLGSEPIGPSGGNVASLTFGLNGYLLAVGGSGPQGGFVWLETPVLAGPPSDASRYSSPPSGQPVASIAR